MIQEGAINLSLVRSSIHGYLLLVRQTFFGTRGTFARLTLKRFAIMTAFLPPFLLLQTIHWLGFALDDLLFRGYRRVAVKQPLFVVGVPRSGTTFLHRMLAKDSERFTTPMLWELIFAPSVTERRVLIALGKLDESLGRPFGRGIEALQDRYLTPLDSIHRVRLHDPEEDYFALLPVLACFLLLLPFPSSQNIWRLSRFDDQVPTDERRRVASFYRGIAQRHLYVRGPDKQLLSKNPSFTPMLQTLAETFPDARFVACIRNPIDAIGSELSAMVKGMHSFGNDLKGTEFRDCMASVMVHYYRHLICVFSQKDSDTHLFVTLESMKGDIEGTVKRIYRRFGWAMAGPLKEALPAGAEKSRSYRSPHRYSLGQFQLSAGEIARQLPDVFERFGFSAPEEDRCHE